MTADIQPIRPTPASTIVVPVPEVIVYGHSWLYYWWPLWVAGYVMAFLIWLHPVQVVVGRTAAWFSADRSIGIIYALLFLLLIVVTSSSVRGMVAAFILVCLGFLALLFAYLDWWPTVLGWFGDLDIFMNLGFYLFVSTALLALWLITILGFDHMSFWRIRAGQVTHEFVFGAVDQSYDTETMLFSKDQSDLFRHWVIGLGSGDLRMTTMGGRGVQATVQNVLFVNSKMAEIEKLIATREVTET